MRRDYLPLLAIHGGVISDETGTLLRGEECSGFAVDLVGPMVAEGEGKHRGGLGQGVTPKRRAQRFQPPANQRAGQASATAGPARSN